MKNPLVSVIMPVYNGEKFIAQAIVSILAQSYQNFELLIVDDCSFDNTAKIIKYYQKRFPKKIHLIHLRKRHGAFGAMNIALKHAQGRFIAPMDSDDISHPERLQKEVEFLISHPESVVVGSFARIIDEYGNVIGAKTFGIGHKQIASSFFTVNPIVHPSCMIRRSLLSNNNKLYHDIFGVNDDYYTFFTLLSRGEFSNIPQYLLDYRIHSGNSSLQNLKSKFFNTVKIRLRAVYKLGYRPNLINILKFLIQIALVSIIPDKLLLNIYLYIKGIHRPAHAVLKFKQAYLLKYG